ncbi:MAG: hypothetical protein IJ244_01805 [Bacteroidaceae bacterium]|nr:hypothetical protein [Bacteroidaceae bacterium]
MKFNPFILLLLLILASCSSTDCPLNNTVSMQIGFYTSETGLKTNIADTLSIRTGGRKSVTLLNRGWNFNNISLPMGYVQPTDTLLFLFRTEAGSVTDTVLITHTNDPHFVSLDCSTALFHTITSVKVSSRQPTENFPTVIDSIIIANPEVNYDETENLKIYLGHL